MSAHATRGRQRSRDLLIKAVYQWQIAGGSAEELLAEYEAREEFAKIDQIHFRLILESLLAAPEEFDKIIATYAKRGTEQLDTVARAVLLASLTEMTHCGDVPTKVVINEAINLAKRYAAADSFRFINAVLDKASKEIRASRD